MPGEIINNYTKKHKKAADISGFYIACYTLKGITSP